MTYHFNFSFSYLIPVVICTVVLAIMVFSVYVTFKYRDTKQYKKTRINVFFSTLASVAIVFVGINIMLSSISFEYNQQFIRITKTKEAVDRLWLYPIQLLNTTPHLRPEFRASFYFNSPTTYNMVDRSKIPPLTIVTVVQEQFIANVILQAWEDWLGNVKYDLTPNQFWLRNFITWAQSPYLKEYYNLIKFEYEGITNQLAVLLFEYAATLPVPVENTNLYETTVDKLMKDPRYLSLMETLQ